METEGAEAAVQPVEPAAVIPAIPLMVIRAPKGREEEFTRKRAAEETLLSEYETAGMTRDEFAAAKKMKTGTIVNRWDLLSC